MEYQPEAGPSTPLHPPRMHPREPALFADGAVHTRTLYVPVLSPPTPSPSPGPSTVFFSPPPPPSPPPSPFRPPADADEALRTFGALGPDARRAFLARMLGACTPAELVFTNATLAPLLMRDFVRELPPELALAVLAHVRDHRTLLAAGRVSRAWRRLCTEGMLWRDLVAEYGFEEDVERARERAVQAGRPELSYRLAFQYCQISGVIGK